MKVKYTLLLFFTFYLIPLFGQDLIAEKKQSKIISSVLSGVRIKLYSVLILALHFYSVSFGQEINFSVETPKLSAGAEYSQFLEKQILLGNANALTFNGNIPQLQQLSENSEITTIEGINFDQDASNSGYYHIPPDPNGAAGPNHLVSITNTSIQWFTKTGTLQYSNRLGKNSTTATGSFFESLSPLTGTFDPKVVYDQYNGRFVVVALEETSSPSQTSRILVAVSQSSDPNAGWYFTSINSLIKITGQNCFADFPGLAVSSTGIYITANMFSFVNDSYLGGRLWIIAKSPLYSGGTATNIVSDHITAVSGYSITYQPTQMFGTAQTGIGTFLVAYSGLSGSGTEYIHIIQVSNSLTAPTFNGGLVSLGDIDNTSGSYLDAPQSGTSNLINTNDRRTQKAVWRNNALWTTFTVVPNSGVDAGQVTAHWVKVNTSTLTISDQGNIGGEDIATGTYTFFPSIAVNSNGDAIIGFAASAPTIYPGSYYAARYSSTPAGTVLASQVLRAGLDYYVRKFGGTRNRWGDFSGSSVDPSDDQTFYIFNQYALTRGSILTSYPTEDGRWGTTFGIVTTNALTVELTTFSASVVGSSIALVWKTESESNNYGFDIERKNLSTENSSWEKIGFINGNGTSNTPISYSYQDQNATSGKYAYRLKQIDNDGKYEYSNEVEIDLGAPKQFELSQNYPNPFNPNTTIRFSLPNATNVKLKIYNILGQEIKTLVNEEKEAGNYTINFNASDLSSGMYVYKLDAGTFVQTKKMTLLK